MDSILIILVIILLYYVYENSTLFKEWNKKDEYAQIDIKQLCKHACSCEPEETPKVITKETELKVAEKLWDGNPYLDEKDMLCGDELLAMKMQHISRKPREASRIRSMFDAYSFAPYISEELRDHENSVWWEN